MVILKIFQQIGDNAQHAPQVLPIERGSNFPLHRTHHIAAHNLCVGQPGLYPADHRPPNHLRRNCFYVFIGADDNCGIVEQMVRYAEIVVFNGFDGVLIKAGVGQIIHDNGSAFYRVFQRLNADQVKSGAESLVLWPIIIFSSVSRKLVFPALLCP